MNSYAESDPLLDIKQNNGVHGNEINSDFSSIELNLMSNNTELKAAGLEALEIELHKYERTVPSTIFKLLKKCSDDETKALVLKRLQAQVTRAVKDSSVSVTEIFQIEHAESEQEYVVSILSQAFEDLPIDTIKKLLCDVVIPGMFNNSLDDNVRDTILDVGLLLIQKFPITKLTNQEIKLYTSKVIEKYTKILEKLLEKKKLQEKEKIREKNYHRWYDLWIFLVRFSAKHLHTAMDLANKLLRVVEFAFRDQSHEQRLKGYDCWKELIDNASLDMNHMCSSKQIKLLVTPLKAKFSKMEVVICKRFEVFLYLMEKLQDRAYLVLNEFLEFCFGVSNNPDQSSKNGQGKLVRTLWLKSIQVFLAVLGDQTYISSTLNRPLFEGSVINEKNISRYQRVIICSVIESSLILKDISMDIQEKNLILNSLWEALFNILTKASTEIQEKSFQIIFGSLSTLLKDFNDETMYIALCATFTHLLESTIDCRLISDSLKLLLECSLKFSEEKDISDEFSQQLSELVQICYKEPSLIEFLVDQIKKFEPVKMQEIWVILGEKLQMLPDRHSKTVVQFFMWPVHHVHKFNEPEPLDICSTWTKSYGQVSKNSDSMKKTIINELDKSFKSNPLLSANIVTLISAIPNADIEFNVEFVTAILKLMSNVMSLPLLAQEHAEKMYDLILKCTDAVTNYSTDSVDLENVNNICQCIEKIPCHQKDLPLLEVLEKLIKKMLPYMNTKQGKRLKNAMNSFSGTDVQRKAAKILSLLSPQEMTNGQSPCSVKRSIRMAQMAFQSDDVNPNKDNANTLQFFGKDINTTTPSKVKGSILQNKRTSSPSSRSKKIISSVRKQHIPEPPMIDDQSCDFVVINTEVKLQKDKLTEHQKEEFRRRREDIPALYQDLSQSHSQTQSLSSSSKDTSKHFSDSKPDKLDEEEKVSENVDCSTKDFSSIDFLNYKDAGNSSEKVEPKRLLDLFVDMRRFDDGGDSNTDSNDSLNKKNSRKSLGPVEKELMRIQMDIVGGDTFLKDLPTKRRRKLTDAIKPKETTTGEVETKVKNENEELEENKPESILKPVEPEGCADVEPHEVLLPSEQPEISDALLENGVDINPNETSANIQIGVIEAENSNNRKNKFVKPKKHVETPKLSRKKNKVENKEESSKKPSKDNNVSQPKRLKKQNTLNVSAESEIMFESQENTNNSDNKIQAEKLTDTEQGTPESIPHINLKKNKLRPKDIMKKNKEKVRTIQSQLKLANLNNLSGSSGQKKTKGAKLIFIREITNSKNVQNTKVTEAGLKRNRDKKSKNIAYTIEPPQTLVDLVSLGLNIKNIRPSVIPESSDTKDPVPNVVKPARKRKRTNSENSSSSRSSTSTTSGNSPVSLEVKGAKRTKAAKKNTEKSRKSLDSPQDTKSVKKSRLPRIKLENKSSKSNKTEATKRTTPAKPSPSTVPPDSPYRSTRSRSASISPKNTNEDSTQKVKTKPIQTKTVKSLFIESEDIIESSQEPSIEHNTSTARFITSKICKQSPIPRDTSNKSDDTEKKDLYPKLPANIEKIPDIYPQEVVEAKDVEGVEIVEPTSIPSEIKPPLISQADTETCDSNYQSLPPVLQVELPHNKELTDSEKFVSAADTISMSSQLSDNEDVVSDPPDITSEHKDGDVCDEKVETLTCPSLDLDDTKDPRASSPIVNPIELEFIGTPEKSAPEDLPGSPVGSNTPTLAKELLDNTLDISPIPSQLSDDSEKNWDNDVMKNLDQVGNTTEQQVSDDNQVVVAKVATSNAQVTLNLRSNKLLSMVNVESPTYQRIQSKKVLSSPAPSNSRYVKLFAFKNNDSEKPEINKDDLLTYPEKTQDILTFSREIPSPLAVPSNSILKRKLAETDNDYSPCAKRKRVNFSYPCISSTKIYIRHKEELNSHFRPCYPQNLFGDDFEDEDSEFGDIFSKPDFRGQLDTDEDINVANSELPFRKKPIYKQLVDCEDNLDELWKRLSSPKFSDALKKILREKNVNTVGDLARLGEIDINRLPFKQPRIKTVRKALHFYFTNTFKKSTGNQTEVVNTDGSSSGNSEYITQEATNGEETKVESDTSPQSSGVELCETKQPRNVNDELTDVLSRIKHEVIPLEDLGSVFLELVDESEVVNLLKSAYKTDFKKFFAKPHWRYLIETIVESDGTPELFDIISDLADNNKIFADQLETIVRLRIQQNPLKDIISQKTLVELKVAVEDCIKHDVFNRENVLQTCFMPLIKNPSDIKFYFNSLTIVQINDLFVERVQPSELTLFLNEIRDHYGNYTVAQCVNKKDVLKICSKEDLQTTLLERVDVLQFIKDLAAHVHDQNKLVELYAYIGNLIPRKSRMNSHIEFLKSIPLDESSVE